MKAEFTTIIEPALEGGYWAICPEIAGAHLPMDGAIPDVLHPAW